MIVGNNYTLSLFVTNMTTVLMFELTVFVISLFILKNKKRALYTTIGVILTSIVGGEFLNSLLKYEFISAIENFAISPGNSARLIRIAIAPIMVLLIYLGFKFFNKSKKKFIIKHKSLLNKIYIAILAGICVMWSNDGGIATYIAVSFVYFLFLIKEYKKDIKSILKYTFMYIVISLISFLIVLTIVTRGNILSWFEFTLGVSSYQKWYYGEAPYKANYSLLNIDLTAYTIMMIGIAIYYIYKLFKSNKEKEIIRYGLLNIMVIAPILSSYLYQFLSGSYSKDMVFLVIMIIAVNYLVQFILNKNKYKRVYSLGKGVLILTSLMIFAYTIKLQMVDMKQEQEQNGIYIEELGGYFTKLGDSIKDAINRIGDEKIFSTYASAVDVATNQYQPTGVDYIIHCMGEKQREEYLNVFRQGDFKYVVTTDRDYNNFRYWIKNANWFFYRELYKDYKPVFATEYSAYWEKNKENEQTSSQTKTTIQNYSYCIQKIKVETENKNFCGVADVKISYDSYLGKDSWKSLKINNYVYVNDITGGKINNGGVINYNIPNNSQEYYIPITIINGVGEVDLISYPIRKSSIDLKSAEVINVYDVNFKYCVSSKNKEIENNTIYIDNTKENKVILNNAKKIKIDNTEQNIIKYEENEEYIKLEVDGNAKAFSYPNFFEVIK